MKNSFIILLVLFLGIFINTFAITNHPNTLVLDRLESNSPTYPIRVFAFGDNRNSCTTCTDGDLVLIQLIKDISNSQIPPAFAVSNGDLVLSGYEFQYKNYLSIIDRANFPIFSVRGNHELYADDGPANFQKYLGDEYFSFTYGSVYVCLFPDCFQRPEESSYGHKIDYSIKTEYLDKLSNDLNTLPSTIKYKFLFTHAPVQVAGGAHYNSYCVYQDSETELLRSILENNNFTAVGFGHWHDYDHFYYNGIHYVLTGGAGAPLYHEEDKEPYSPPDYGEFNHYVIYTMDQYGGAMLQVVKVGTGGVPDNNYLIRISSSTPNVSPSRIDSLRIRTTDKKGIYELTWFATGDDGITGKATSYVVKYSNEPIKNQEDFDNAITYEQSWIPAESGYYEHHLININDLDKDWYFAVEAQDDEGNISPLSNVSTLIPKSYIKKVFPNPFHPAKTQLKVEFVPSITDTVYFNIYTIDGKAIFNDTQPGNIGEVTTFYWDGKIEDEYAASGIYLFTITIGNKHFKGKFAIIK